MWVCLTIPLPPPPQPIACVFIPLHSRIYGSYLDTMLYNIFNQTVTLILNGTTVKYNTSCNLWTYYDNTTTITFAYYDNVVDRYFLSSICYFPFLSFCYRSPVAVDINYTFLSINIEFSGFQWVFPAPTNTSLIVNGTLYSNNSLFYGIYRSLLFTLFIFWG